MKHKNNKADGGAAGVVGHMILIQIIRPHGLVILLLRITNHHGGQQKCLPVTMGDLAHTSRSFSSSDGAQMPHAMASAEVMI